jgi:hypothetical protein
MVQTLNRGSHSDEVVAALFRDGGVIVANQASNDVLDPILEDLRGPFDEQGHKFENDFNGYKTLRLGGILGLSRASADLIAHPRVMEVADAVLKRHCSSYRIGSSTAIEVHPGEAAQVLHRDGVGDEDPARVEHHIIGGEHAQKVAFGRLIGAQRNEPDAVARGSAVEDIGYVHLLSRRRYRLRGCAHGIRSCCIVGDDAHIFLTNLTRPDISFHSHARGPQSSSLGYAAL